MSGDRRRITCALLVLSLLLSHLPFSSALALTPAPAALAQVAQDAAPDEDCCATSPALAVVVAVDACCAPPPPPPVRDACCESTAEPEAPAEDDEPCCPTGCKHCPRPCCSAPLALLFDVDEFTVEFWAASRVDLPLADHTCAAPESVFHPPRV